VIPVKVAVRIRPISKKEKNEGCQTALEVVDNEPQVYIPNTEKSFTYDFALGKTSTNEELYNVAVAKILKQLFRGYNVTVLAYGQTGSGKTHSMGTAYSAEDDPILEGVIPRSVKDIFQHIVENKDTEFLVKVSFMELYNEQLFDLLSNKPRKEDTIVDIREDGNKGIKIPGLTETPITSMAEAMLLLEKASEGRVTAATAMNARSSRSHAIFTLGIEAKPKSDPKAVTISRFHLVDLAGSERQKKTKAKGDRLKEGININMGLLSLGNVISALGEENRGANSHIPYRDSKLTRLLQDSLGGNSHTLMIACVSPADSNLEETVSTLRYADRARKIKNKPIVNKDPKAAELGRLRSQVQQLQLQLVSAAGGMNVGGGEGSQASQEVIDENQRLVTENGKLTSALQAAMDDNGHMSEKLLMSEMANEKLKLKLTELSSQAEQAVEQLNTSADATMTQKDLLAKLKRKVDEVKDSQKHAEKTMMEHEISRFNPQVSSEPNSPAGSPVCPSPGQENLDLGGATQALKQNELANQLAELNKVLVAKQELAGKMGDNDEKMSAMRKKYEETLKSMETEISRLQKEKDELAQHQRAGDVGGNGKMSEIRRKRIQELEGKIAILNQQQKEQQRLLKLNSQNEAKIKKYTEEILQMKQLKVKLIKQMKEENEKVRQWKATKEKEVNQLKQKERRAQVAMSSMSQKHERRENVLKRKMEEANATTKRLKDALAKKEAVRKQKAPVGQAALTGAGERVRGWLSSEVELVVTSKEAEKSKVQLIKERKSMTEELNKLRQELRRTTTAQEREEAQGRQGKLQSELDIRNAQISELQQQIMGIEQDKEKESKVDKWTRLVSMVDAKLAVQYLFDQATDAMASAASKSTELREVTHQYEELREIRNELKEQVNRMNMNHEDEIVRLERDHEERVLFLLRQLPGQEVPETKDVSLNQEISEVEMRLKFQAEEIAKMSTLHDQLLDKDREVEVLKEELKKGAGGRMSLMPRLGPNSPVKKDQKKRVTIAVERVTEEEFFSSSEDSSDEEESESDSDPEWRKTPMFKRIKAERKSLGGLVFTKRKRGSIEGSDEELDEEEERPGSKKRSSSTAQQGCTCTTGCKTKRCSCRKAGPYCSALCKCTHNKCAWREVPGADVSSAVETDKENASMDSDDDNDNTNKLLDSTFETKPRVTKLNFAEVVGSPSPRSPLKPLFKTPVVGTGRTSADMFAADSDMEATPTNTKSGGLLFASPQF